MPNMQVLDQAQDFDTRDQGGLGLATKTLV